MPSTPEVPLAPAAPAAPVAPAAPDVPSVPDVPAAPSFPDVPEVPSTPLITPPPPKIGIATVTLSPFCDTVAPPVNVIFLYDVSFTLTELLA